MVVVGDPRQRRHRLALAAGAEDQHLVGAAARRASRGLDERVLGHVDVAEVARDVQVLAHRAADDGDLAPDSIGDVGRLLHAVDVRGEARRRGCGRVRCGMIWRNASPTRRSEPRHARPLGVRRVAEQQVDAAVAELGEPPDVGLEAVDRRVVELPVAGVDDAAGRRLDHDRDRVGDRVRHAHELEPERAELRPARPRGRPRVSSVAAQQAVLVELRLDQAERQPRRPDLGRRRPRAARTAARRRGPRAPCVSTIARTRRGSRGSRSRAGRGRRRGARRAGTRARRRRRSISPASSNTVMFLPTSPRPPSGMMRSASLTRWRSRTAMRRLFGTRGRLEQPEPLEAAADLRALVARPPRRAAAGGRRPRGRAG